MKLKSFIAATGVASLLVLSSCSSTPKETTQKKETSTKTEDAKAATTQTPQKNDFKSIYFDFNKFNIREDQKEAAQSTATMLQKNSNIKIEIQGHTDDRGSAEYNMALGTKRAESLKKFLTTFGIPKNRISTTSFGKERPAMEGSNENAWSKNRRDEIVKK